MNGQKIYVLRRSKTEIHTYEGRSLRTAEYIKVILNGELWIMY
jgi:hypothetical protein